MTDVTAQDIQKLAKLARIELKPQEEEKLAKEIGGILGYIDQIQNAAGKDIERKKNPVRSVMRDDTTPHETGMHTDAIVAEFPRKEANSLKVKKIL